MQRQQDFPAKGYQHTRPFFLLLQWLISARQTGETRAGTPELHPKDVRMLEGRPPTRSGRGCSAGTSDAKRQGRQSLGSSSSSRPVLRRAGKAAMTDWISSSLPPPLLVLHQQQRKSLRAHTATGAAIRCWRRNVFSRGPCLSCEIVIRTHATAAASSYFFKLGTWLVFVCGCVKHSCGSQTVFTGLDAANYPRAAQTQKLTKQKQLINKTPLERAVGERHASTTTLERNGKQSVEPAGKWTLRYQELDIRTTITMCSCPSYGSSFKSESLSWYLWHYYLISEQSTGSGFSEGIAPCRNPNKQGIFAGILHTVLLEFCSCLRDLRKGERKTNPERKLIHSQASTRHFRLDNNYHTEVESSQVSSWIWKHQVNQHRCIFKKLWWNTH